MQKMVDFDHFDRVGGVRTSFLVSVDVHIASIQILASHRSIYWIQCCCSATNRKTRINAITR